MGDEGPRYDLRQSVRPGHRLGSGDGSSEDGSSARTGEGAAPPSEHSVRSLVRVDPAGTDAAGRSPEAGSGASGVTESGGTVAAESASSYLPAGAEHGIGRDIDAYLSEARLAAHDANAERAGAGPADAMRDPLAGLPATPGRAESVGAGSAHAVAPRARPRVHDAQAVVEAAVLERPGAMAVAPGDGSRLAALEASVADLRGLLVQVLAPGVEPRGEPARAAAVQAHRFEPSQRARGPFPSSLPAAPAASTEVGLAAVQPPTGPGLERSLSGGVHNVDHARKQLLSLMAAESRKASARWSAVEWLHFLADLEQVCRTLSTQFSERTLVLAALSTVFSNDISSWLGAQQFDTRVLGAARPTRALLRLLRGEWAREYASAAQLMQLINEQAQRGGESVREFRTRFTRFQQLLMLQDEYATSPGAPGALLFERQLAAAFFKGLHTGLRRQVAVHVDLHVAHVSHPTELSWTLLAELAGKYERLGTSEPAGPAYHRVPTQRAPNVPAPSSAVAAVTGGAVQPLFDIDASVQNPQAPRHSGVCPAPAAPPVGSAPQRQDAEVGSRLEASVAAIVAAIESTNRQRQRDWDGASRSTSPSQSAHVQGRDHRGSGRSASSGGPRSAAPRAPRRSFPPEQGCSMHGGASATHRESECHRRLMTVVLGTAGKQDEAVYLAAVRARRDSGAPLTQSEQMAIKCLVNAGKLPAAAASGASRKGVVAAVAASLPATGGRDVDAFSPLRAPTSSGSGVEGGSWPAQPPVPPANVGASAVSWGGGRTMPSVDRRKEGAVLAHIGRDYECSPPPSAHQHVSVSFSTGATDPAAGFGRFTGMSIGDSGSLINAISLDGLDETVTRQVLAAMQPMSTLPPILGGGGGATSLATAAGDAFPVCGWLQVSVDLEAPRVVLSPGLSEMVPTELESDAITDPATRVLAVEEAPVTRTVSTVVLVVPRLASSFSIILGRQFWDDAGGVLLPHFLVHGGSDTSLIWAFCDWTPSAAQAGSPGCVLPMVDADRDSGAVGTAAGAVAAVAPLGPGLALTPPTPLGAGAPARVAREANLALGEADSLLAPSAKSVEALVGSAVVPPRKPLKVTLNLDGEEDEALAALDTTGAAAQAGTLASGDVDAVPTPLSRDEVLDQATEATLPQYRVLVRQVLSENDNWEMLRHTSISPEHALNVDPVKAELKPGAQPVRAPARQYGQAEAEMLMATLLEAERQGVMRRLSLSESARAKWAAELMRVPKHETGKYRVVCLLGRTNASLQLPQLVGPNIRSVLMSFAGHKFFVAVDLLSGYSQVFLHEDSQQYFVVRAPDGSMWTYLRVPQGWHAAVGLFQAIIRNHILRGCDERYVRCVIDDIIVSAPTLELLLLNLREVLARLREAGALLKLKKAQFLVPELHVLGCVINEHGRMPDPDKVQALRDESAPRTRDELSRFLGRANFFNEYITGLSMLAAPLRELLRSIPGLGRQLHRAEPFAKHGLWTAKRDAAFRAIKASILDEAVINHAEEDIDTLVVYVDASLAGHGCLILAAPEGTDFAALCKRKATAPEHVSPPPGYKVLAAGSRAWPRSTTVRSVAIAYLEAKAAVYWLERYDYLLEGRNVVAYLDCQAAIAALVATNVQSRGLVRLFLRRRNLDVVFAYVAGTHSLFADHFSRVPYALQALEGQYVSAEGKKLPAGSAPPGAARSELREMWGLAQHLYATCGDCGATVTFVEMASQPLVPRPSSPRSSKREVAAVAALARDSSSVASPPSGLHGGLALLGLDGDSGEWSLERLREAQEYDRDCTVLAARLAALDAQQSAAGKAAAARQTPTLVRCLGYSSDGLLCVTKLPGGGTRMFPLFVVPASMRELLLRLAHVEITAHAGFARTLDALQRVAWWPGITVDVRRYVASCARCAQARAPRRPFPRGVPPTPEKVFAVVHLDFLYVGPGSDGVSDQGFTYVLGARDALSGLLAAFPARGQRVEETLVLLGQLFQLWGHPECIISDNGQPFSSDEFARFLSARGIRHQPAAAYHPTGNAMVERVFGVLLARLRALVEDAEQSDWPSQLDRAVLAINSASLAGRGAREDGACNSPFQIVYGPGVRALDAVGVLAKLGQVVSPSQEPPSTAERLEAAQANRAAAVAQRRSDTLARAAAANKGRRQPPDLQVGSVAWLRRNHGQQHKLAEQADLVLILDAPAADSPSQSYRVMKLEDGVELKAAQHRQYLRPADAIGSRYSPDTFLLHFEDGLLDGASPAGRGVGARAPLPATRGPLDLPRAMVPTSVPLGEWPSASAGALPPAAVSSARGPAPGGSGPAGLYMSQPRGDTLALGSNGAGRADGAATLGAGGALADSPASSSCDTGEVSDAAVSTGVDESVEAEVPSVASASYTDSTEAGATASDVVSSASLDVDSHGSVTSAASDASVLAAFLAARTNPDLYAGADGDPDDVWGDPSFAPGASVASPSTSS